MKGCKIGGRLLRAIRFFAHTAAARRGSTALEFAVVMIPFVTVLLFVMELAYDLFTQEILDSSLYLAVRQIQTGNAQNALSGADFINNYMAPNLTGFLTPANVYIQVKHITPSSAQDYYNFSTGTLPSTNGSLDLTTFSSASFCNAGSSQLLLVSAIYIGPAVVGGLLPNVFSQHYNGTLVHATLSTIGIVSENFPKSAASSGSAAACS